MTKRMTDAQRAQMAPWVRRWVEIGLSTQPADRPRYEAALRACYRHAGLKEPRVIVWAASPFAGVLARPLVAMILHDQVYDKVYDQVGAQVRAQVDAQVRAQVCDQVLAQVREQVSAQVCDQVSAQVCDQVCDKVSAQVGAQVRAQVSDQVRAQVCAQVSDQVRAQVRAQVLAQVSAQVRAQVDAQVRAQVGDWWRYLGGQFWASWVAYSSFCREVLRTDLGEELNAREAAYRTMAETGGWCWPHHGFAVVCERPTRIARDDRGRLHCEDGQAISWSDGWGVWAWHGVRVTRQVIEFPESITVEQVRAEQNAETRRVMIERMGIGRYLRESGATVVDVDGGLVGQGGAPRALLEDSQGDKWLVGTDGSTARCYHMSVPREAKTCREAHEGIAGFPEDRLVAEA